MEEMKFEIWCKTTDNLGNPVMFYCKSIYQKWDEEEMPFRRRAKRIFKKYEKENENDSRKFYLLQYDK